MAQLNFNLNREQINALFQKHKLYFILGGIVLVLAAAGLIIMALNDSPAAETDQAGKPPAEQSSNSDAEGTFLPQSTRTLDSTAGMRDPFTFMELKGIISGSSGKNLAIIEDGNNAYVVEKGAAVAGNWTVVEIDSSGVLLEAEAQELRLEFNGRAKAREVPSEDAAKEEAQEQEQTTQTQDKEVTAENDSQQNE